MNNEHNTNRVGMSDLVLVIKREIYEVPFDRFFGTTTLPRFRSWEPGPTSAYLNGVFLSKGECENVVRVMWAMKPKRESE